jgi:serine/threonine protein kinase
VLASLNHPDIAAIHGLEESGGRRFIVMEFVDGETLAHRLLNRPLPADDALDVCRQIAEGLEAAHEHGIIHRDLKPGNVMITADGKVKLLGFGLAKAPTAEPAAAIAARSPTVTAAMTRAGTVLGTPAYMSPEQAKGKAVDKKADIWAFGCILYECLTGKAPFKGETVTETLAKILEGTPDLNLLPPGTPWRAKELLHRCLRKIPGERLRDIGDARIEITWRAGTSKARPIVVPPLRLSLVGIILTRIWALPCRVREGIPRRPGATLPLPWLAPKMVGPSGTLKL